MGRIKNLRNKIRQRRVGVPRSVLEKTIDKNVAVMIEKNDTKLGKPFIVKFYKDGVFVESIPYDSVEEIDFNYIRQRQGKSST